MPKRTASIQVDATLDKVWKIVSDGNRLKDWLSPVRRIEGPDGNGQLERGRELEVTIGRFSGAWIRIEETEERRKPRWTAGPFLAHMMRTLMYVELTLES